MAEDIGGVWRTIGGRRVFIKTGQSLSSAMKASGKFKRLKRDYDPDEEEAKLNKRETAKIREYREQGMTLEEAVNKADKEFEKERDEINNKRGRQYDEAKKLEQIRNEKRLAYERAQDKYDHYKWDDNESEYKKKYKTAYNEAKDEYVKAEREYGERLADDYRKKQIAKDKEEAQTIHSISKLVQMEMKDTGDESVDQFVNRLVGKNAKSVEAKRTELNKRLEYASEEYRKYAKSLNYTEKFRDEFEYWDRERKLYAELVNNYDKLHKKKPKAKDVPLF